MSRGRKAARMVVGSGLSTAGSGQRGCGASAPAGSTFIRSGTSTGSAREEARPRQEPDLHQCWARFSSSCKQGISQVNIKYTPSERQPSGAKACALHPWCPERSQMEPALNGKMVASSWL